MSHCKQEQESPKTHRLALHIEMSSFPQGKIGKLNAATVHMFSYCQSSTLIDTDNTEGGLFPLCNGLFKQSVLASWRPCILASSRANGIHVAQCYCSDRASSLYATCILAFTVLDWGNSNRVKSNIPQVLCITGDKFFVSRGKIFLLRGPIEYGHCRMKMGAGPNSMLQHQDVRTHVACSEDALPEQHLKVVQ